MCLCVCSLSLQIRLSDEEDLAVACCLLPVLSGADVLANGGSWASIEAMVTGPTRFAKHE